MPIRNPGLGGVFLGLIIMKTLLDQQADVVKQELVRHGWQLSRWRPELLPNAMSRKYETAVGLKEALVWIVPAQSDSALQLTAEYWSEGRNALSCCFSRIPVAEEEEVAISKVSAFLAGVEKSITETYAVRLWKLGVGRDDACRNSCAS